MGCEKEDEAPKNPKEAPRYPKIDGIDFSFDPYRKKSDFDPIAVVFLKLAYLVQVKHLYTECILSKLGSNIQISVLIKINSINYSTVLIL